MLKKEVFNFLKTVGLVLVLVVAFMSYIIIRDDRDALDLFEQAFTNRSFYVFVLSVSLLAYVLFLIIRYFTRVFKKQGLRSMIIKASLRFLVPIALLYGGVKYLVDSNSNEAFVYTWDHSIENTTGCSNDFFATDGKLRGMTVFNWRRKDALGYDNLVKNNIEWVAIVPFFYQEDEKTSAMSVPGNNDRWSRRDSMFIESAKRLKDRNIRIMLKPHLWLGDGWRSNVNLNSEAEWKTWFKAYKQGMLHYAKIASDNGVDLLCIGTELRSSLKEQPDQWKGLIADIKNIYKGKLTYAANWDGEYDHIDFWGKLDYIGIQGYYPLTDSKNPELKDIKIGWDKHLDGLQELSEKYDKPILFTEIGYKNESAATIRPWEWGSFFSILFTQKSNKTQQLAYEALYQKLWDKDWFAGTFIWQWNSSSRQIDFTPQDKPAQNTIAKWYGSAN